MKSNTILALLSASAAATALPRRNSLDWEVTNFSVESVDYSPTTYNLTITGEGLQSICLAENSVPSSTCTGANGPAPFTTLRCGPEYISAPSFSWEFNNGTSPVANGGLAYSIKFTYAYPGQPDVYGCSPQFPASDSNCVGPPGEGEILNVPSSFTVSTATDGECVYV